MARTGFCFLGLLLGLEDPLLKVQLEQKVITLQWYNKSIIYLKSLLKKEFFLSKLFGGVDTWFILFSTSFSTSSLTCLSARASFLDNLRDPPLDERLLKDFLDSLRDWLLSKNELLGEDSADSVDSVDFSARDEGECWSLFPLLNSEESEK